MTDITYTANSDAGKLLAHLGQERFDALLANRAFLQEVADGEIVSLSVTSGDRLLAGRMYSFEELLEYFHMPLYLTQGARRTIGGKVYKVVATTRHAEFPVVLEEESSGDLIRASDFGKLPRGDVLRLLPERVYVFLDALGNHVNTITNRAGAEAFAKRNPGIFAYTFDTVDGYMQRTFY